MGLSWSKPALEDLRGIGHKDVIANIIDIAEREISIPSSVVSSERRRVEGFVGGPGGRLMWRRAVRYSDLPAFSRYDLDDQVDGDGDGEFDWLACNYVVVYRRPEPEEITRAKLPAETVVVVGVLGSSQFIEWIRRLFGPDS